MGRRTVVAFHAHPDDEAVLTAGTMAQAAARGHRVVLVLATDGGLGGPDRTAEGERRLGQRRLAEARESARVLGAASVEHLGYADSGPGDGTPAATARARFVDAPRAEAAQRLATILTREAADVLLSYDVRGGYGHPDHVRVHEVAAEAARVAGTPRVLQATAPREPVRRVLAVAARFGRLPPGFDRDIYQQAFTARAEITHDVPVHAHLTAKRASLRAHASQTAPRHGSDRMLATALRLPRPLYGLVFGREWFVDPDHEGPPVQDILAGLP